MASGTAPPPGAARDSNAALRPLLLLTPLLAVAALRRAPRKLFVPLVLVLAALNLPHTEPKGYLTLDDEHYAPSSIASRAISASALEEYEPRAVASRPPYTTRRLVGVQAPVEIVSENVASTRQELRVRTRTATAAEAATFYYPGWRVLVDGVPADVEGVPGRGTIGFSLPGGSIGS
jgi:hypothetical protein